MFKLKISQQSSTQGRPITQKLMKIRQILIHAIRQFKEKARKSCSRPKSPPNKRRSDQSSQSQSIIEILHNMKKGYLMIKHSQNTPIPHNKFVYLSNNCRYLCWKSVQKNDEKRIDISTISKVIKEGSEQYMKGKQIKDICRCIVVISAERTLQLQVINQIEAEIFKYELERVLKYSQGMHLNYKYTNS